MGGGVRAYALKGKINFTPRITLKLQCHLLHDYISFNTKAHHCCILARHHHLLKSGCREQKHHSLSSAIFLQNSMLKVLYSLNICLES